VGIHFITGGDEADQMRDGDYVGHDDRYRRTGELMGLLRRVWTSSAPFDHDGEFYRYDGAFSSVKPATETAIPLYFGGASLPAIEIGAEQADVYMLWGEPLAEIAKRISEIRAAAARFGRTVRFSVSTRPILADTEDAAWARAEEIAGKTRERIESTKKRVADSPIPIRGIGGARNSTSSSVGRQRLLEFAQRQDVYDERLWTKIANLTGAGGNSTALVGTPAQVAESLLRYYDLGVTSLLIRGFDPYEDAIEYGEKLLPLVRQGAAERDARGVRVAS
jgi:alkanesulfonate monooxygenase